MEHEDSALDPKRAAELVVRTVDDIDASNKEQRESLLCDFLCAAWATAWAQNQ